MAAQGQLLSALLLQGSSTMPSINTPNMLGFPSSAFGPVAFAPLQPNFTIGLGGGGLSFNLMSQKTSQLDIVRHQIQQQTWLRQLYSANVVANTLPPTNLPVGIPNLPSFQVLADTQESNAPSMPTG